MQFTAKQPRNRRAQPFVAGRICEILFCDGDEVSIERNVEGFVSVFRHVSNKSSYAHKRKNCLRTATIKANCPLIRAHRKFAIVRKTSVYTGMTTKKNRGKRALNLSLPEGVASAALLYSAATGESVSDIVERLLREFLETNGMDTVNPLKFIQSKMKKRAEAKTTGDAEV